MPPRYAYWTILVDDQPTAFRASAQEDLLPTLKRLQAKHPSAKMMWWQNGKLWDRRVDAQDAMHTRGEFGRRGDSRQAGMPAKGGFRDRERKPFSGRKDGGSRSAWSPRGEPSSPPPKRNADDKLDWKPKGEFVPAPKRADREERPRSFDRGEKPAWKPKGSFDREERPRSFARPAYKPSGDDTRSAKPEWKPKGTFDRKTEWKPKSSSFSRGDKPDWKSKSSSDLGGKPEWKPRGSFDRESKPAWKPKSSFDRGSKPDWKPRDRTSRPSGKLDWKPKGGSSDAPTEKRQWVPKEEYKKSMGIEVKRDAKWRPGGLHKDPKQKYKDAKKAKWTKFKKAIRTRAESKGKKNDE